MNSVGPRIRFWRKVRGWSQEQLAGKVQIKGPPLSRDVIANIETQRSSVPADWMPAFAAVLEVDILDLFSPSHPLVPALRARAAKRHNDQAAIPSGLRGRRPSPS
jgi:transcriptional regulator with XRE-family HTH domain